jgi:hypothetical protein
MAARCFAECSLCLQCHDGHVGLVVCLDASLRRLAVLAVRLGGAAFGGCAVALFCGSWCCVGGLVQALDVVCALE